MEKITSLVLIRIIRKIRVRKINSLKSVKLICAIVYENVVSH